MTASSAPDKGVFTMTRTADYAEIRNPTKYYLTVYDMDHENYVNGNFAAKICKIHGLRNTTDYGSFFLSYCLRKLAISSA
jgi:hypothetical protein